MRFPAPFAALLRERPLCYALLSAGILLVGANVLKIRVWVCAFRELTGLPCPGCGMTRAMSALCKGQLERALSYHPLSPLVFVALLMLAVITFLPQRSRAIVLPQLHLLEQRTGFSTLSILALLGYGIWRITSILLVARS
jgi:hypothetical protein